ncbi:MAG: TetR/AcrR family transcriptional regulator [Deltaproteobacteria bacterium]|nr:TetR/AcrR family transcriptional regulator [Deltaproteobacteria bacterium]
MRDQLKLLAADAILTAAERVFIEEGLHAAKMEHIAARAGVAVGTLYNHFGDRAALLTALINRRRDALLERIDSALHELKGRPFPEQLEGFFRTWFRFLEEHGSFVAAIHDAEDLETINKAKRAGREPAEQRIKELIRRGVQMKALRPEMAEELPLMISGLLRIVSMRSDVLARKGQPVSETMTDFVLRGAGA